LRLLAKTYLISAGSGPGGGSDGDTVIVPALETTEEDFADSAAACMG
jgi:hypothetical protein